MRHFLPEVNGGAGKDVDEADRGVVLCHAKLPKEVWRAEVFVRTRAVPKALVRAIGVVIPFIPDLGPVEAVKLNIVGPENGLGSHADFGERRDRLGS